MDGLQYRVCSINSATHTYRNTSGLGSLGWSSETTTSIDICLATRSAHLVARRSHSFCTLALSTTTLPQLWTRGRTDFRKKSSKVIDHQSSTPDLTLSTSERTSISVHFMKNAQKSRSDCTYKTVFKILGPKVYKSLRREQQSIYNKSYNK